MNGWTALHWASKRGHGTIVDLLMKYGADPSVANFKEETAVSLCSTSDIASRLGTSLPAAADAKEEETNPTFVPNYIRHPPFPYVNKETNNNQVREATVSSSSATDLQTKAASHPPAPLVDDNARFNSESTSQQHHQHMHHHEQFEQHPQQQPHPSQQLQQQQQQHFVPPHLHHPTCQAFVPYPGYHPGIFVLKVRVADQLDPDFIEVEFPRLERDVVVEENDHRQSADGRSSPSAAAGPNASSTTTTEKDVTMTSSTEPLTFESFVEILCDELRIPTPNLILKIRKLPDTIVRKGRDVHRLKDFQEIEVVLSKKPFSESSSLSRPFESNGVNAAPPGYHTSGRRSSSSSASNATTPVPPSTATILY